MTTQRRRVATQYGADPTDSLQQLFQNAASNNRVVGGTSSGQNARNNAQTGTNRAQSNPDFRVNNQTTRGPSSSRVLGDSSSQVRVPRILAGLAKPRDMSQYNKTVDDFIAQARQIVGSSQQQYLNDIAAKEAALRQNANQNLDTIGKDYAALSAFISGQSAPISSAFQTGIDQSGAAGATAQSAIQQATSAAQAQQQAILANLGIQDANIAIANNGNTLEAQMAANVADSAGRTQATQDRLSQNQQSALNANTMSGNAAALEGQGQRNRITQNLASAIADLQSQRGLITSGSDAAALELAQSLMNNDYQIWSDNYNRRYQTQSDAANLAIQRQQAEAQANQAPEMTSTAWGALGPAGQANYALQQQGVDPQQAQYIVNAVQTIMAQKPNIGISDLVALLNADEGIGDKINAQNAAAIYQNYFN